LGDRVDLFERTMRADSKELVHLRERVVALEAENALLRQKIDALVRRVFGATSERIDPAQLELLLQLPAAAPAAAEPARPSSEPSTTRPRREHSPRLPDDLPIVEQVLDPEPVQAQPEQWRCIGQEVSEQLDYEPARFLRRRTIRRKYVHRADPDRAPLIAPLPQRLQDRSLAAPGLLAHILVSKYCDHLPLYRQEQIFARRHGVHLPRQTLARWVALAADWLKPIYEHIRTGVLSGGYVQIDETPIRYLAPGHGQTKHGYLWTAHRPRGDVVYRWETSRAAACLENIVPGDFAGTLQCDGYAAYGAYADRRAGLLTLAGCWAHVRRKFHDALQESPRTAGWLLRQMQHLYRIEAHCRQHHAGPRLREATRTCQSRPIVRRIQKALVLLKASHRHLPQSLLGQAIDYALGQWSALEVFLDDGRVEIDNNLVENAIRPTAVGKKNWLFIGDAQAGERSAIIYTVIESCHRRGIEPYTYLREVLTRLPTMTNWQVADVTPDAWAKAHRSKAIVQAS
jgi:transposase